MRFFRNWLRSSPAKIDRHVDLQSERPEPISTHTAWPTSDELERRRLLARETLVAQRRNVDTEIERPRLIVENSDTFVTPIDYDGIPTG